MKGFQFAVVALGLLLSGSVWAEDEPSEPSEEQRERTDWRRDTSVQPIFHYGRFRADEDVYRHLELGGEAALHYAQKKRGPKLKGETRVHADWQIGLGVRGRDLRVGSFIGPALGPLSLSVGPDLFHSQVTYDSLSLDPVIGVSAPLILTGDLKLVRGYIGVIPSWYLSGDRPGLDGEGFLGMGDESAFVIGSYFTVVVAHMGMNYQLSQNAFGNHHQVGFSVGLGM
jgi:hypothetical protein